MTNSSIVRYATRRSASTRGALRSLTRPSRGKSSTTAARRRTGVFHRAIYYLLGNVAVRPDAPGFRDVAGGDLDGAELQVAIRLLLDHHEPVVRRAVEGRQRRAGVAGDDGACVDLDELVRVAL